MFSSWVFPREKGVHIPSLLRVSSFFGRDDAISFILSLLILSWICIVRTKFWDDWSHNLGLGLAYKYNFVHWGLSHQGEYNIKLFPREIKSPRDLFCFVLSNFIIKTVFELISFVSSKGLVSKKGIRKLWWRKPLL